MRASEQLIVKCAAVLGQTFPRDMIEYILPKVQRVKARKSFKRLKQIGIFECANIPNGRAARLLQSNGLHPEACFCPKMEDDYNADLCNVMRFKNNLLQQTAYNILMESQRLDLHNKTVEYLENQADEIRKRIPYYLLYRKPKDSLDNKQGIYQIKDIVHKISVIDWNLWYQSSVRSYPSLSVLLLRVLTTLESSKSCIQLLYTILLTRCAVDLCLNLLTSNPSFICVRWIYPFVLQLRKRVKNLEDTKLNLAWITSSRGFFDLLQEWQKDLFLTSL